MVDRRENQDAMVFIIALAPQQENERQRAAP
jgi:hypothetical protein